MTGGEERQPIHAFAAAMGLAFLLVGIAGFIPGLTSNYDELEFAGPESQAELFGLFQVSIVHNIVHLLFAVGLLARPGLPGRAPTCWAGASATWAWSCTACSSTVRATPTSFR